MSNHKSIRRIIHRAMEELSATKKIAEVTSWKDAFVTFRAKLDIQVMNRNGFQEPEVVKKRLQKKHEVMLRYFETKFDSFIREYDFNRVLPETDPTCRGRVWVCWWQGLENAPELVKKCIESICRNAGNHEVTIITEDNYREYITVPDWIADKFQRGIITRTNFSDFLRLSLLAEYGGLWLDATFFCTGLNVDACISDDLWSIKRPDYLHASVASGYFAGYSLACTYTNRWIFTTIRDFFSYYWKENDMLIDYLLIDYMIALAQRCDPRIATAFQEIQANNPQCDELCKVMNQEFDEDLWNSLRKDTHLFKLTWKQSFVEEKEGKSTFYGKLLDGSL